MTESQQDVAPKPRGTGMFLPLRGRDPCQQHPKANQQDSRHKRQHRNPCRSRSRTTAVYMPFSNTGTQFHPPACLPVHPVCPQPGQLLHYTQPQQQHTLMQLPHSGLGPRCSSDHSSSSQSSYVLQHNTAGDPGHPAMSAGFVAPASQVSTQQQTVLVHTHSLSSGSSTSSVHGAVHTLGQGLGSCAEVTVSASTALQPQQAQLLGEEGSSGAIFSNLGPYSSSGSVCAGQYSIWGPVGQQGLQHAQHEAQGPCGSDANLTGWTAALQPSSSSPGLAPGAVYADQDHPVMQVAAASSTGLQAGHPVLCAGQHQAAVMQMMPAISTGLSAGQPVYCAEAHHAVMQIAPAVSTAPGVPAGHMVYCADPGQPVMQVAPAGAVLVLQDPNTQQMQHYQLVPVSTAAVGGLSAGAIAPSIVQWGH